MKLLLDEHLSPRLVPALARVFPGSAHVETVGLGAADDAAVWQHAKEHGFAILTKDADFTDLAVARGVPPKVIWLRVGNRSTTALAEILAASYEAIREFLAAADVAVLALVAGPAGHDLGA